MRNRNPETELQIVAAKKQLYTLMFDRQDWGGIHDVIFDITNISLAQEGLEEIFDQLPDIIQFDAFKWGLNDTEVLEKIHKHIIDNEISFR